MSDITQAIPDNQNTVIRKWKDMGDGTWAEIIASVAIAPVSSEKTLISSNSSVGSGSAIIVPAGTFASWVTIQNTHATQNLYVGAVSAGVLDFKILPGAALTLPFGIANAVYGYGSGAATTFALIGA